ncbi:SDR family NAD(P)-dependent oxidoreductase [Algoriphagus pacificus]|uniref:SDR family NAD(P)-dependent oxidoreductase n=1 Tax=Algoriphagus pacificus TaxID=2811234 RepID=A0ABS3CH43_9BACT|nr:SDR family NAD(P)-dependent oxidoreductase [Algoriphagus pacificus]MBN7816409.1 SDR family NAD(P)-dependent oxidoreductase [Algoriphagus pacificus]
MNLVITGSTSGIGLETVRSLYPIFDKIIVPVRNLKKAEKVISSFPDASKFDCFEMDLSSMKSVNKAGKLISEKYPKIDLLINNAGGMFPQEKRTNEGLDWTFAVNHLGHFHLTSLLIPNLLESEGKIIFVSSEVHRIGRAKKDAWGLTDNSNSWTKYGSVKLYNILTSKYLNDLYETKGLTSYSLHPGAVNTSFGSDSDIVSKLIISLSKVFFISPKKGAETSIFLAKTEKDTLKPGGYYEKKKLKSPSDKAEDLNLQKKLYDFSLKKLEEILS